MNASFELLHASVTIQTLFLQQICHREKGLLT